MSDGLPPSRADLAWFFDVDGTVAEIALMPESVVVDPRIGELLHIIHARSDGALALVSGRSLADLDAMFPERRYAAAGQHGLERRDISGKVTRHAERTAGFLEAQVALADIAHRFPALHLEVKGLSLALHYRRAPQLGGFVHREMRRVLAGVGPGFHLQQGKRVVELLPAGSDKGSAVRAFMAEPPFAGRTPIFIGDDVTDERAFETVNTLGGYSVKVGPGPTVAKWRLDGVTAVRNWLEGVQP